MLTGDRKGTWSLHVTRNRRLTFRIDTAQSEVYDVNLEDYHWERKETTAMRMLNPPHPGDFIRTEIIAPRGLSVTAVAGVLQVSRPALSSLLNGKADLSGDMALRIERAFGVKMDTLRTRCQRLDFRATRHKVPAMRSQPHAG